MQLTKLLEGTATIEREEFKEFDGAKKINLEYYMLEIDACTQENQQEKVYGIQVVKTETDGLNKINMEVETIADLSTKKENVKDILQKLIKHRVTPISLYNVLEDIVGVH